MCVYFEQTFARLHDEWMKLLALRVTISDDFQCGQQEIEATTKNVSTNENSQLPVASPKPDFVIGRLKLRVAIRRILNYLS